MQSLTVIKLSDVFCGSLLSRHWLYRLFCSELIVLGACTVPPVRSQSAGSVTDRMSADIHASYENLSTSQQRAVRETSPERRSSAGSRRSGTERRDQFYETSEYESQRRETGSAGRARSEQHSSRGGGSQRGAMSERSARVSAASRPGSRGSLSRRDSGFSFEPGGSLGGSGSAGSVAGQSSLRRPVSPRPAASARLSPAEDAPGTLQRVLQPADDDGQETDGFTTRFVRQETAGSRRAASATTLYMAPTAAGATGSGGTAAAGAGAGAAGFGQKDGDVDDVGYPRRASGDWRRRSSAAELVVEDEVCDLEEREEVISSGVKERLSYHQTDAQSSLEKSARYSQQQQQQVRYRADVRNLRRG